MFYHHRKKCAYKNNSAFNQTWFYRKPTGFCRKTCNKNTPTGFAINPNVALKNQNVFFSFTYYFFFFYIYVHARKYRSNSVPYPWLFISDLHVWCTTTWAVTIFRNFLSDRAVFPCSNALQSNESLVLLVYTAPSPPYSDNTPQIYLDMSVSVAVAELLVRLNNVSKY